MPRAPVVKTHSVKNQAVTMKQEDDMYQICLKHVCTMQRTGVVICVCLGDIEFATVFTSFLLYFGIVPIVW